MDRGLGFGVALGIAPAVKIPMGVHTLGVRDHRQAKSDN